LRDLRLHLQITQFISESLRFYPEILPLLLAVLDLFVVENAALDGFVVFGL
jgi:hypothetical protein